MNAEISLPRRNTGIIGVLQEMAIALRKVPQPRPLRVHQRAVMLLASFCISLLVGWLLLVLLRGEHYVIFVLLVLPAFVALKISGLFLRGSIMSQR
jgi:hypothetical protein